MRGCGRRRWRTTRYDWTAVKASFSINKTGEAQVGIPERLKKIGVQSPLKK
jgi:hypothetical protein